MHSFLVNFFDDLDKFNKLKTKRKKQMFVIQLQNHNDSLGIYFDECYELPDAKRKKNTKRKKNSQNMIRS